MLVSHGQENTRSKGTSEGIADNVFQYLAAISNDLFIFWFFFFPLKVCKLAHLVKSYFSVVPLLVF